jgi:site-specific DNA-methyltransferase (adenine-specific)
MGSRIIHGNCVEAMAAMPEASVDACVTDPPYGLSREPDIAEVLTHWLAGDDYVHRGNGFMGSSWDSFVPGPAYWREVYRVLKPGAHLVAFGGTRTYDLLCIAIRLAGFEIRDRILHLNGGGDANGESLGPELDWLYGSGFP